MTEVRSLALLMSFGSLAPPATSKTLSSRVPVKLAVVVPWPAWKETFTVSCGSCMRSWNVKDRGVPTRPLTATSGANVLEATPGTGASGALAAGEAAGAAAGEAARAADAVVEAPAGGDAAAAPAGGDALAPAAAPAGEAAGEAPA